MTRGTVRIGIDGRVLQESQPSGISHYAHNLIAEMIKSNQDVTFVIFYNAWKNIAADIPKFGEYNNIENHIYRFPSKLLELFWMWLPYPKVDKLLNVDYFFSPHFLHIPLSKKIKKVVTIHDVSFEKNKRFFNPRRILWHKNMRPRKICQTYNKIIAVSQFSKDELVKTYGIEKEKIAVVYNGSPPPSNSDKENIIKKWGLEQKNYILFIATLEPRKNVESIIDAYRAIRKETGHKLVIAGKKGWLFSEIFNKVKKYNLDNHIVFTGFVSEEEKKALLANATVFIFPSFYEGFGLPIVEAAAHRVPIVTSSVSSMPEIMKSSAILINPHSIGEIAQSLSILLKDIRLQELLVNKAMTTGQYSWRNASKKTMESIVS